MFPNVITSYRWIISFHRPSWDHCGPFQAPVSPKGWQEIKQFCKKTTTKDQGELPLQFPSEFIFEEKKNVSQLGAKALTISCNVSADPSPGLIIIIYVYMYIVQWCDIDSPDDEKQWKMKKWRWRWFKVATKWRRCSTADVNWLRRQGEVLSQQHKKGKKWV